MRKTILAAALGAAALLAGCNDADVASHNLSVAADNFGITGEYMLTIEGLCSLGNNDPARELSVTCKVGPSEYKKHFLGLSDNVTYFAEQIDAAQADVYHYAVVFKPSVLVPAIQLK